MVCKHTELVNTSIGPTCIECGLVTRESQYQEAFSARDQQRITVLKMDPESNNYESHNIKYQNYLNREYLMKYTAVYQIPKNIIDDTLCLFAKLNRTPCMKKRTSNSFKGKNKRGLLSACLFIAFRNNHCERTASSICEIMGIRKRVFSQGLKLMMNLSQGKVDCFDENVDQLIYFISQEYKLPVYAITLVQKWYNCYRNHQCFNKHKIYSKIHGIIHHIISDISDWDTREIMRYYNIKHISIGTIMRVRQDLVDLQ